LKLEWLPTNYLAGPIGQANGGSANGGNGGSSNGGNACLEDCRSGNADSHSEVRGG